MDNSDGKCGITRFDMLQFCQIHEQAKQDSGRSVDANAGDWVKEYQSAFSDFEIDKIG